MKYSTLRTSEAGFTVLLKLCHIWLEEECNWLFIGLLRLATPSLKQFDHAIPDRILLYLRRYSLSSLYWLFSVTFSTFYRKILSLLPPIYFKIYCEIIHLFTLKLKPVAFSEHFSSYTQRYQVLIKLFLIKLQPQNLPKIRSPCAVTRW